MPRIEVQFGAAAIFLILYSDCQLVSKPLLQGHYTHHSHFKRKFLVTK